MAYPRLLAGAVLVAAVAASPGCGDSTPAPRAKKPSPAPAAEAGSDKPPEPATPAAAAEAKRPAKPSLPPPLVPGYRLLAATLPRPEKARPVADDEEGEDRFGLQTLPIRVTVYWNPVTQKAKLYVNLTFTGTLDGDGLAKCLAECRDILKTDDVPGIEIDAQPDVPWDRFLRVYAALRSLPAEQFTFGAGSPADATPTDGIGKVPARLSGWIPPPACAVEGTEDVRWPARDDPLCLAIDPAVGYAVRFGPTMTPTAMRYDEFGPYLRELVKRRPAVPGTKLSALKLALFMPAEATWRHAMLVLMTSASLGVWDFAFAVAAPPPEQPK